jgi:hypothetical protein
MIKKIITCKMTYIDDLTGTSFMKDVQYEFGYSAYDGWYIEDIEDKKNNTRFLVNLLNQEESDWLDLHFF